MSTDNSRFAHKVRHVLDRGADQLDRKVVARLQQGRQYALDRQRVTASGLSLAGVGHFSNWRLPSYIRTAIAAFALLGGVVFTYYWNSYQQAAENAEVDSALLSDDLPPAAFLDKGFQVWIDRSSQSQQ